MAAPNRYSTVVTWVKVALPLLALALLSTMFLFSRAPNPEDALPFAEMDIEQLAREQRLSRPRFAGTLEDGREVTLVADTATPETSNPNQIHLSQVDAQVVLAEDDTLVLTAEAGDVDLAAQQVALSGSVNASTSRGLTMLSDAIEIAMDSMHLVSPGPVVITGEGLTLEAGAMDISGPEGEAFLSFTGGVSLLYRRED